MTRRMQLRFYPVVLNQQFNVFFFCSSVLLEWSSQRCGRSFFIRMPFHCYVKPFYIFFFIFLSFCTFSNHRKSQLVFPPPLNSSPIQCVSPFIWPKLSRKKSRHVFHGSPLSCFYSPRLTFRSVCPCICNKYSQRVWFETCLKFDSWKNIQRMFFCCCCCRLRRKSIFKSHGHYDGFTFFVHIYIYICMLELFRLFQRIW